MFTLGGSKIHSFKNETTEADHPRKNMRAFIPVVVLLLSGCVSYTYDIADRPPYSSVPLGPAYTVSTLHLYRVTSSGGSTFRGFILSPDTVINSRSPWDLIAIVQAGTVVEVQRIFREKGADGYLWDFVFGSIVVDGTRYEFETNLGLSDSPRPLPFESNQRSKEPQRDAGGILKKLKERRYTAGVRCETLLAHEDRNREQAHSHSPSKPKHAFGTLHPRE